MAIADETHGADEAHHDPFGIRSLGSSSASGTRVLKHGETFAVVDQTGDIPRTTAAVHGLFHAGTRFLSALEAALQGERLLLLSSGVGDDGVLTVDLTNADVVSDGHEIAHGTIHVLRTKFLSDGTCYERLRVENFGARAVDLELRLQWCADFRDLFELRGMSRDARGRREPAAVGEDSVELGYRGLDDVRRVTTVSFAPRPSRLDDEAASFRFHLTPKQSVDVDVVIECDSGDHDHYEGVARATYDHARAEIHANAVAEERQCCKVRSSNERFDAWLHRCASDLRLMTTETEQGPYPYAGIPWFSTPFGRDGIITALLSQWLDPKLSSGVLRFLAAHQADRVDEECDAEPGKIIHELRRGEMAALREIPFGRYYGSVDATPLFIMLADAHHRATGDLDLVREIWGNVERALAWIEHHGDRDGDGFLEYDTAAEGGLVNQGWKDSGDAIFHADGTLAEGPIALAEVQGYAYAAWRAGARLAAELGSHEQATRFDARAETLAQRFDVAYWCDELGSYALALDGRKRPCRVRASNGGHCLLTGIARPDRARRIGDMLMAPDMFSGWGIRTVSTRERAYNPLSYHNGSVWPHDNALIGLGLARFELEAHAARILQVIFEASELLPEYRTPELFCGFARRRGQGPTQYPLACAPQAWAAASVFGLLKAVLGMKIRAHPPRVSFERPVLPPFLDWVELRDLAVGTSRVTIRLHRFPQDVGVNVAERIGPVSVTVVK